MSGMKKYPYKQIELDEEKVIKNIQLNIYRIRTEKKISVRMLALKSGVQERYIYKLENGIHKPNIIILTRLAKALDVEISELMGDI